MCFMEQKCSHIFRHNLTGHFQKIKAWVGHAIATTGMLYGDMQQPPKNRKAS